MCRKQNIENPSTLVKAILGSVLVVIDKFPELPVSNYHNIN